MNAKEELNGLHLDQPAEIWIGAFMIEDHLVALLPDHPNSEGKMTFHGIPSVLKEDLIFAFEVS